MISHSLTTYFPDFVHNVPLQFENGDVRIEDQPEQVVVQLIQEATRSHAWAQDPTLRQFIKEACERVRNSMPHEVKSLECYTTKTGLFTSKLSGRHNTQCFHQTLCTWLDVLRRKRKQLDDECNFPGNYPELHLRREKIDAAIFVTSQLQEDFIGKRSIVVAYDALGRIHGAARVWKFNETRDIEWLVTSPYDFSCYYGKKSDVWLNPVCGAGAALICHIVPKKKFKNVTVNSLRSAATFYSHLGFSFKGNVYFYLSEEGRTQILNKYLAASHRIKYMDVKALANE